MEYQEFKDKLINHCKAGGLSICKDNSGVFLTLSLSYTIFDFSVRNYYADTPGFKYRLSSFYPEEFSEKIVSFDEELLDECIKIADKWILKIKKKIINERKADLEKDFDN